MSWALPADQALAAPAPFTARVDYHGSREVPTGTCRAIFRAAGISDG